MKGELKDVTIDLGTRLRKFKQYVAEEFLQRVKNRTPVETGALQNGWGFTLTATGFTLWNIKDYCAYVEFGTEKQPPKAMFRTTLAELEDIHNVAAKRAGLK